ncbi:MAG TPA: hypothetical protein VFK02_33705 [Kofleriaceae bacterium]|nr:hypothetical protein [Kofleriaceae bacterium]
MSWWSRGYNDWAPRKGVAERRADAARHAQDAARRGRRLSPVAVTGRTIARTFWGKAWCDNLERYRDFAYRLERGRSYLRSGSVIDLRIEAGKIAAVVSGSSLYDVAIVIEAVGQAAWRAIQRDCAGSIGSRVDLLTGTLSAPVMARLCADRTGLFPAPSAIKFTCSCPDYATMCKHVAATMYGVGARLDHAPELLFTLRRVSADELLASAITELPAAPSGSRVLAAEGLASLFGIELAEPAAAVASGPARGRGKGKPIAPSAQVIERTPTTRSTQAAQRTPSARTDRAASSAKPSRSTGLKAQAAIPPSAPATKRSSAPATKRPSSAATKPSPPATRRASRPEQVSAAKQTPPIKPRRVRAAGRLAAGKADLSANRKRRPLW